MTDTHLNAMNFGSVAKNERNDENTAPLMESDVEIKLTDVNQLCLEHIFMYLDLENPLSVAHANKYLGLATIHPFSQKYGQKQIRLLQTTKRVWNESNVVTIPDLRIIFQVLRCFGQSIKTLKIDYVPICNNYQYEKYQRIMDYANEFCAESLTNFVLFPAFGLEKLKKPFGNVEEIIIRQMKLQEKCLSRVFPKLRRYIL